MPRPRQRQNKPLSMFSVSGWVNEGWSCLHLHKNCSCRQPTMEIHRLLGHLKSQNPKLLDPRPKSSLCHHRSMHGYLFTRQVAFTINTSRTVARFWPHKMGIATFSIRVRPFQEICRRNMHISPSHFQTLWYNDISLQMANC